MINICKPKKKKNEPVYTSTNPRDFLKRSLNKKFTLSACPTSSKYKIVTQNNEPHQIIYMPRLKQVKKRNLGVMSHVKSRAKKLEKDQEVTKGFKYGDTFNHPDDYIFRGYEIDVKRAYWQEAFKRGLCSLEMFDKFSHGKDRKLARNMSIGALYSTKSLFDMYPNSMNKQDEETGIIEPFAPNIYKSICNNVVMMLAEIGANCKTPLFYWVDQIYVSGSIKKRLIRNLAKSYGHEVTITPVVITRVSGKFFVNSHEGLREFFI
jgi:hypothetical protein